MSPLVLDPSFAALKAFIIARTGLHYFDEKDDDLAQRVARRIEALGLAGCAPYLEVLKTGVDAAAEFDHLAGELTIGETYFMRHEEQFDDLRTTIFPELIARNQATKRLRVWCAGCSIGAEPYSLAIILNTHFADALAGWDVRIIATDINRSFLARAAAGIYDEWTFRTTSPEFRALHFLPHGKSWQIRPEHRALVEFKHHNLVTHPWSAPALAQPFDLITCRNVMIYFDRSTVTKVMQFFTSSLSPLGWLVIGHAEFGAGETTLELRQLPRVTAYRKRGLDPVVPVVAPAAPARPITAIAPPPPRPRDEDTAYLRGLANAGEFELALACAADLLRRDPRHAVAHYYRALILMQTGGDGEPDLARAVALDPEFVMAHYQLGLALERRGRAAAAERAFRRAIALLARMDDGRMLAEGDDLRAGELRDVLNQRVKEAG